MLKPTDKVHSVHVIEPIRDLISTSSVSVLHAKNGYEFEVQDHFVRVSHPQAKRETILPFDNIREVWLEKDEEKQAEALPVVDIRGTLPSMPMPEGAKASSPPPSIRK